MSQSELSILDQNHLEKEAIETILAIKDEFINTIPEDIFVRDFLPTLANINPKSNLVPWINVAGHVYNEVIIVDKNNQVLYKVPPVMSRNIIKQHVLASKSLSEIVELSRLHSRNSPRQGMAVLEQGLSDSVDLSIPDENDFKGRWLAIFKKYGYHKDIPGEAKLDLTKKDDKPDQSLEWEIA